MAVLAFLCVWALHNACAQLPSPPASGKNSVLAGYRLVRGPITVAGVTEDLSGVTYDAASQSLWMIVNGKPRIIETDLEGNVRRSIELTGFEDTEDLVSLGNQKVAIIEERQRTVSVCTLPPEVVTLAKPADARQIEPEVTGNSGLEGIAYDAHGNRFFVVKEKKPRRIYEFSRAAPAGNAGAITHPWDAEVHGFALQDLSGLTWDAASGHLLLLSDESRCVVECTPEGQYVGRLPLTAGAAGLNADLIQPEGITHDAAGRLYIVCEPNLLYIFAK